MEFLKINGVDLSNITSGLKIGYETLVSSDSGRNAAGNTVLDVVNQKIKVYATFRYMSETEMKELLGAIESYVINVEFINPKTNQMKSITAYTGTPEPEYFTLQDGRRLFKSMNLNFIEL